MITFPMTEYFYRTTGRVPISHSKKRSQPSGKHTQWHAYLNSKMWKISHSKKDHISHSKKDPTT